MRWNYPYRNVYRLWNSVNIVNFCVLLLEVFISLYIILYLSYTLDLSECHKKKHTRACMYAHTRTHQLQWLPLLLCALWGMHWGRRNSWASHIYQLHSRISLQHCDNEISAWFGVRIKTWLIKKAMNVNFLWFYPSQCWSLSHKDTHLMMQLFICSRVFLDIATLLLCWKETGIIGMLRLLEICTNKQNFYQMFRHLQEVFS